MNEKTEAIVLHTTKYAENSIIIHTYTKSHGLTTFIANGTRSKRSALRNAFLQPLTLLELNVNYIPKKEIQRASDCQIIFPFKNIPYNPSRNALAIFIAELLYKSIKEPDTDNDLFSFIYETIQRLDDEKTILDNFHLAFLIQYARFMGFAPQNTDYLPGSFFDMQNGIFISNGNISQQCLNKEESALLAQLCSIQYANMGEFHFSKEQKKIITNRLIDYYRLHLISFQKIKSLDIIYQLFEP